MLWTTRVLPWEANAASLLAGFLSLPARWRRGKHILMCIIKALIYLHAYNIAHLVSFSCKSAGVMCTASPAVPLTIHRSTYISAVWLKLLADSS